MFAKLNSVKLNLVITKGLMSMIIKMVAHVSLIWHTFFSHTQTLRLRKSRFC